MYNKRLDKHQDIIVGLKNILLSQIDLLDVNQIRNISVETNFQTNRLNRYL